MRLIIKNSRSLARINAQLIKGQYSAIEFRSSRAFDNFQNSVFGLYRKVINRLGALDNVVNVDDVRTINITSYTLDGKMYKIYKKYARN